MARHTLKKAFWLFMALTLATLIAIGIIDTSLRNTVSAYGIVSFEFCGFTASCEATVAQWSVLEQKLAMLLLGIDYLFLLLYPGLIFIALLLAANRLPASWQRLNLLFAKVCVGISLADAVENYALIQILLTESAGSYGIIASCFALLKFFLFAVSLIWLIFIYLKYVVRAQISG